MDKVICHQKMKEAYARCLSNDIKILVEDLNANIKSI